MLREQIHLKLFIVLSACALLLGLGLAQLLYPPQASPRSNIIPKAPPNTETVRFIFPEQTNTGPFKTPPNKQPDTSANNTPEEQEICAQVITSAVNPATLEIQQFSTPCDVPKGWRTL